MYVEKQAFVSRGLDYKEFPMSKSLFVNKHFLNWILIGWQAASQTEDIAKNPC